MTKSIKSRFFGVLNEPILEGTLFPFGAVPGQTIKEKTNAIKKEAMKVRIIKLYELLNHYQISPDDKHCWLKLSLHLAIDSDFVPGMKILSKPARRGRPQGRWGSKLQRDIRPAIEAERKSTRKLSVKQAIKRIQEKDPTKWGGYKISTLQTAYYETKPKSNPHHTQLAGLLSQKFLKTIEKY